MIDAGLLEIRSGNLTIAGQTAPGAGITIRGQLFGAYTNTVSNIILRHLRVRAVYNGTAGDQFDAMQFSRNHHLLFDHLSVSGGVDETVDLYESTDVTVQWSTIESSGTMGHPEGMHNYGLINGPDGRRVTVHHTLFAHHRNRCPAIANGPAEVVNNVVYNSRHGFIHHNPASGPFNLVGNWFRRGPTSAILPFFFDDENASPAADLRYFLSGNWNDGMPSECPQGELSNPWMQCTYDLGRTAAQRAATIFDFTRSGDTYLPTTSESAMAGYNAVLARAGAWPRDVIARRSVSEAMARTGDYGARVPSNLMEGLTPATAPADVDNDGIADAWEMRNGLDPSNAMDNQRTMPSGYPAIEQYLNELAEQIEGRP